MIVHNRIPGRPRTLAWLMLLLFGVTALFVSAQFVQADPAADASPAATPSKTPTADTAPFAQQATNAAAEGEVVDVPAADPFAGSSSPFSAKADEADPFGARKSPSSPSIASLRPDEILFFNASWVGPGQKMIPIVEKLQQEGIRFRILDVDKDAEIAKRHGVTKIPMFIAIKKGFEADRRTEVEIELNRLIGVQSEKSLRELAIRQVPYRSGDARTKTLEGLRNVIESKDEPAEVKIQAMRSYSRLAFSTDEEATAEKIFLDVAKAADNHRVKLAAAEALQTLGSPKGVELMWSLLETSSDADFQAVVTQRLNDAKAVPPSVESVRTLTGMMVGGALGAADSVRKEGDRLPNYSPGLLKRLASSGNGIARLVEAVEMSDETEEVNPDSSWMPPTSRSILLIILREAKPATDEITDALVEALSSKDAGVRAAAAQALGNPVEPKPASGRGMESGIGGRAPEPDQQPGYEAGAPETTLPSAPAGAPGQVRPTAPATPARPATGAPTKEPAQSPAISDKVRDELIKSLSAAAQDETATPESRAAALESLAKIAQGTENAAEVTAIAKRVLERASNALEQEGAAAALHRLGDSEGIEALWKALAMSKPKDSAMIVTEDSARIVNRLAVIETPVPATTEGIVALARFVAKIEKELDRGRRDSSHLLPLQVAGNDLLKRLYQSGQGVQRCIAAIESLEDSAHGLVAGTTEEDPQFEQQARARLLALLRRTEPTNDEVATALAEALSSDDSDVRKAAAEALGNVRRASKPEL